MSTHLRVGRAVELVAAGDDDRSSTPCRSNCQLVVSSRLQQVGDGRRTAVQGEDVGDVQAAQEQSPGQQHVGKGIGSSVGSGVASSIASSVGGRGVSSGHGGGGRGEEE